MEHDAPGLSPVLAVERPQEGRRARYLVIVASTDPELCEYLTRAFSGDDKVEVRLDGHRAERRAGEQ